VLLADEPTGNLDEDTRDDIMLLLERLWRERGLTLVLVTHDTSVARRAQTIGVMNKGHLTIHQAAPRSARGSRPPVTHWAARLPVSAGQAVQDAQRCQ
jgi:ABC-type lipoprotein export system ATPase subunit